MSSEKINSRMESTKNKSSRLRMTERGFVALAAVVAVPVVTVGAFALPGLIEKTIPVSVTPEKVPVQNGDGLYTLWETYAPKESYDTFENHLTLENPVSPSSVDINHLQLGDSIVVDVESDKQNVVSK
jgi:hypothetical protein